MSAVQFAYRFGSVAYDLRSRTHVMGILNVTPDSFSDGGRFLDPERAVQRGLQMVEEGANFIDVGGESTRPKSDAYGEGAEPVSVDEETARVVPVIRRLAERTRIPISIDTYKSEVAREALAAGAVMVNDISGFRFDPRMPEVVGAAGASAVLMHIKGTPKTMQLDPKYPEGVMAEVGDYLKQSIQLGKAAGVRQMLIDPGLGFGKRLEHNLEIIRRLHLLCETGCPIVVGTSRKSFIGAVLGLPVEERLEGTLAVSVACVLNGANVVRVHDVRAAVRACRMADALKPEEYDREQRH